MSIAYINGQFLPKDEIRISPDDRGFLFADGVYEVVKWYSDFFFDMEDHLNRLKRSMNEIGIKWPQADRVPSVANELIRLNSLNGRDAMLYVQVTRGVSPRSHSFPQEGTDPTVYAFVRELKNLAPGAETGVKVLLRKDIRWGRCDIKSISLLPNTLAFQEATELGYYESVFVKDGVITEGSHSNIFFVINGRLFTHPESENILAGITRKNILLIAGKAGIGIKEEAVSEKELPGIGEAFITSTTEEIVPVVAFGKLIVGNGVTGSVTRLVRDMFRSEILTHKS